MPQLSLAPNAVAQPMKEFMGNAMGGLVSTHIPELPTMNVNGSIPVQQYDFAYSADNDFGGSLPSITNRTALKPKQVNYEMIANEFNLQFTWAERIQFETLVTQQEFATAMKGGAFNVKATQKKVGEFVMQNVIQNLSMRVGTFNETLVHKLVTDPQRYIAGKNVTLINEAIPTWDDTQGGELAGEIAKGFEWINRMSGNMLVGYENGAPVVAQGYEVIIIVPRKLYTLFSGVWNKAFAGFNTMNGYSLQGKEDGTAYRSMTANLFGAMSGIGGAKVVIAESYLSDDLLNELNLDSDNFRSIWSDDSIYMFATSTDILKPASIMKPTHTPDEMFSTLFLDSQYVKTHGLYTYVSPQERMFYKIGLVTE